MSERTDHDNPRSCDEIEELLPLYPLGVLDAEEMAAVDAHIAICPACAAELLRYQSVSDMLGEAVAPAELPANGRVALLERAAVLPQDGVAEIVSASPRLAPVTPIATPKAAVNSWKAFALAAAAALILLAGGAAYLTKSLMDDRDEYKQSSQQMAQLIDANTTMTAMSAMPAASAWDGKGVMMESKAGEMAVAVTGCPPSTDERVYKVWVAEGTTRVVLGEMTIGADGKGWLPVTMPSEMPQPQTLGVSMFEGSEPVTDLFIGQLSTT